MIRRPQFTSIVRSLTNLSPFISPFTIERQTGKKFQLRLGANESSFGISPKALSAMEEALRSASWYGDPESYELRQTLSKLQGVPMQNILVGSGIDDLLGLVVRVFLNPGDVAVASAGTYPTFAYHVKGYGGQVHRVPYTDELHHDLTAIAYAARKREAKIIYLANPDNPSGTYYRGSDIKRFLDDVPNHCVVILDEAYIDFAPEDAKVQTEDPRLITMRTFSKAHGLAGTRIGYAICNSEIIDAFHKVRLHYGVNSIAQAGALASLNDREFVQSVVREVEQGRRDYKRLGAKLGLKTIESHTNFVCFDMGDAATARRTMNELLKRSVFVRRFDSPPFDRFIRVTVGSPVERKMFADIFEEVMHVTSMS